MIYIARVDFVGSSFIFSSEGEITTSVPGCVVFTLYSIDVPKPDPENGPDTKFLIQSQVIIT